MPMNHLPHLRLNLEVWLDLPIIGPRKIPIFPLKAKKLNALACVFGVLFSEIIVLTVLFRLAQF